MDTVMMTKWRAQDDRYHVGTIAAAARRIPDNIPATIWRDPRGGYTFTVDWWSRGFGLLPGSVAVRRREQDGEWTRLQDVSMAVCALAGWIKLRHEEIK